jgi:hypothetical protein
MQITEDFLGGTLGSLGEGPDRLEEGSEPRQTNKELPEDPYADCPPWARDELPARFRDIQGIRGLDPELRKSFECWRNGTLNASGVAGVDLYQANHFLPFRTETAAYLYENDTPLELEWPEDYLSGLRQAALRGTEGKGSPKEKVKALLETVSRRLLHPYTLPLGDLIPGDRNFNEDELILSGVGWCNEQARVLVRACQAVGVPARLIHFFYANVPSGHTVVEFYDGSAWCLVDMTYYLFFPALDGQLMSASACHDRGKGQERAQEIYRAVSRQIVAMGERWLSQKPHPRVEEMVRTHNRVLQGHDMQLHSFGIMNYPLPPLMADR